MAMSGRLGAALGLGVVLALVIDLLLRIALDAVRLETSRLNWEAAVASKAVWLVSVGIGAAVAPRVLPTARHRMDWREAFQTAGIVLISAPLIWTVATVLVFVTSVPFAQSSFYAEIMTSDGPWLLAGAALSAISRHVAG
jgi:hypothetical protein